MSRSKKGGKPPGYDFWTARPFNKGGGGFGSYAKKRTHKAERAEGRKDAKKNEDLN